MSASFALTLSGAPFSSLAPLSGLRFASAALALGHKIEQVFLYQDGIYLANAFASQPEDELNLTLAWQQLAQEHSFPLYVCVAGAIKRGLLSESEAQRLSKQRQQKVSANLAEGYELASLAELATMLNSSNIKHLHFS
mgnify:CR=1 FL=1